MMLSPTSPGNAAAFDRAPAASVRTAWLRYRTAEGTTLAVPFVAALFVPLAAWWWGWLSSLVAIPLALLALGVACGAFAHVRGALATALAQRLLHAPERLLRAQAAQSCPGPLLLHSWHDGELGCAALDDGALRIADRETGFEFVRIDCNQIIGLQHLRGATRNLIVIEFLDHDRQLARWHLPFATPNTASEWNRELRRILQSTDARVPPQG